MLVFCFIIICFIEIFDIIGWLDLLSKTALAEVQYYVDYRTKINRYFWWT